MINWLFPPRARCMGCDEVRLPVGEAPFCDRCRKGLEKAEVPKPRCGWCGYPMQGNECLFCKQGYARYIHWVCAPFIYRGPVRQALPRLKYGGWGQSVQYFGSQMAKAWRESGQPDPDLVTYVPMLSQREKARGGNQARMLCEAAAHEMGWEVTPLLARVRQSESQVGLSRAARRQNMRGCFEVIRNVRGRHVLLVDDVVTTGATAAECARMLVRAGAAQVWVLAAALNLRKK